MDILHKNEVCFLVIVKKSELLTKKVRKCILNSENDCTDAAINRSLYVYYTIIHRNVNYAKEAIALFLPACANDCTSVARQIASFFCRNAMGRNESVENILNIKGGNTVCTTELKERQYAPM